MSAAPGWAAARADGARADGPRRTAFVVGNSNYRSVNVLENPRRDARAISAALKRIGFDVTTVIDGDQKTLVAAMARFAERSRGSDIALFYYAGHGIQINGENYFLPVSVKASSAEAILAQSVSLNEVRRNLNAAKPGLSIFILDSCRENPFGPIATTRTSESSVPLVIGKGLAQVQGAAGMLIAYATQPGKLAFDGRGKHSPFTESLLRYFEEPGLEIRLMLGRVREDVVAKTGGRQIPWVEEAVLGEFYFSEPGAGGGRLAGAAADDEVVFWRSIWRSTDAGDYEAYLAKFPEGTFAALASNRLSAIKASARLAAPSNTKTATALSGKDWRLVKNSLYWLGYYNGTLTGEPDTSVTGSIQAFQSSIYKSPSGRLSRGELNQLHDAAAGSLISLGERLSERIAFDSTRLRSIDRGINDIALPAYRELKQRLAGVADGAKILAEARQQLATMRQRRDRLAGQFKRDSQHYLTVVAAAGAGYARRVRLARGGKARGIGAAQAGSRYLTPRRQAFLQHALDYAEKGSFNERAWLKDLR